MASPIPEDFRCPISLDIMSDPVILSSGHTFDRSSIQQWLNSGNRTCPLTNLPLPPTSSLIPNHAIRSLISNHLHPHPHHQQPQFTPPETLISTLTMKSTPLDSKIDALHQLANFSKRSHGFRQRLAESGLVSALLDYVRSENHLLQESALNLLLNLSVDAENKVGLVAEGAIGAIVAALVGGAAGSRAAAATMLTSLAVVEVNKATIGGYPSAIRALVSLLRDGGERERREAATALFSICSFPENRVRAVECGAVAVLIRAAESGVERGFEVLGILAKCGDGRGEMARFPEFLNVLVGFLKGGGSSRGVRYALLTLCYLCCHVQRMRFEAMKEDLVEMCVGFLEDDDDKIRRNACTLIHLLCGGFSE